MDVLLTSPKRASHQAALVVICGTLEESKTGNSAEQPVQNFLVQSVLPLKDEDATTAKASMLRLISLIALGQHFLADGSAERPATASGCVDYAHCAYCAIMLIVLMCTHRQDAGLPQMTPKLLPSDP